jgi:asparagine synthase (glutamine-hydrolysing)
MCGIIAVFGLTPREARELRARIITLQKRLRHRGPDWSGVEVQPTAILAHERLGIVDPESGNQPLLDDSGDTALAANGEIYNHQETRRKFPNYPFRTHSDCESILPLYKSHGVDCASMLDGQFAFVISDASSGRYYAARDPIGINPLYYGHDESGRMWFASEMKALKDDCPTFQCFPPGHYYDSVTRKFVQYYKPAWYTGLGGVPAASPLVLSRLRDSLIAAVEKRLMTDVPWGVLLSGGLDSSLVASIASRLAYKRERLAANGNPAPGRGAQTFFPRMHSFCIGLEGSPDLAAAQKVADFLKTVHHSYTFTVQEGLDAYSDVIYHLETYDVTTVRAATPMYLMMRKIKACGVKMVLSGEGADEVMAGYLYFHKAPSREELFHETVRKLKDLHYYDCLRANKSAMAWGVEARVPFLDVDWLETAMTLDPVHKMSGTHPDRTNQTGPDGTRRIEKWALREAFHDKDNPWLPESVLFRQKEQFSDGVGYSWIDSIKARAADRVTDQMLESAPHRFPHNTPKTKEAYYIRKIFEGHFPQKSAECTVPGGPSIACSSAKAVEWDESFRRMVEECDGECSGRAVMDVHNAGYKEGDVRTGKGEGQALSPRGGPPAAKRARAS